MYDFQNNVFVEYGDIKTSFKGKELILLKPYFYYGPITMQYLPYGGIQSVYNYHLIINIKEGFIAIDEVVYDQKKMSSKDFILLFDNIVNEVLLN